MTAEQVARRLRTFGEQECRGSSALYEGLSLAVAGDRELCGLIAESWGARCNANLVLNSVHFLLLGGAGHPLRRFFPDLTPSPARGDPYPAFRDFWFKHRDALALMLRDRITQTNEVARCSYLYPALCTVSAEIGSPLALIDVGCAAGLNLQVAEYRYDYGRVQAGPPHAAVSIACDLRGDVLPPVSPRPRAGSRLGLDMSPVDVRDEVAVRWLRACIWPEHADRFARLDAAVAMARADPPEIIRGDALETIGGALGRVPAGMHPVVVEMTVMPYLSREERGRWVDLMDDLGSERDISWIVAEGSALTAMALREPPSEWSEHQGGVKGLALITYRRSGRRERVLGTAHAHGRWLEWRDLSRPAARSD